MTRFLLLVQGIAPILYAVGVLACLWAVRGVIVARGELNNAQFSLEREHAQELGGRSITLTVLSIEFILLVFFLSTTTYNEWETFTNPAAVNTPVVVSEFATSVPVSGDDALSVPTPIPDGPVIIRTQPPSPTPAGTLQPADDKLGCQRQQADILIPQNGQVITETEPILGTATIANFGYYRFEIRNIDVGGAFAVIGGAQSDNTTPAAGPDSPLGQIIPQNYATGEYRFRLTIFDTSSQIRAFCEITIFISDPIPTPTPIGAAPVDGIQAPTAPPE